MDGGGALSRAIDMLLCICPLIYRSLLESPMGSCATVTADVMKGRYLHDGSSALH